MSNPSASVSVIMPVYNGARFILDALDSIARQAYSSLEVIIVDDGSTDNSRELIEGYTSLTTHYIFQSRQGPAAARNRALHAANGDMIAFLDADDLWPDNKIKTQLSILTTHPQVDVVHGAVQLMMISSATEDEHQFLPFGAPSHIVSLGSIFCRKYLFKKIGFLDETLASSEDVDWFMRLKEHNIPVTLTPEVSLFYRIHQTNMTSDKIRRDAYFLKAIKKSLDRRIKKEA